MPQNVAAFKDFMTSHDISGIRAVDDRTIEFTLTKPAGDFVNILALMRVAAGRFGGEDVLVNKAAVIHIPLAPQSSLVGFSRATIHRDASAVGYGLGARNRSQVDHQFKWVLRQYGMTGPLS